MFRGDTAVGLVQAIRQDERATRATRQPSNAFLHRWLADLGSRTAVGADVGDEALAFELLLLCQEYRLGVLDRSGYAPPDGDAGDV